jgi:histidyl-tRNA synthetase
MERLHMATTSAAGADDAAAGAAPPDAFVVAREPDLAMRALAVARSLRGVLDAGAAGMAGDLRPLRVMADVQGRSASSQMKVASRVRARYVVFVNAKNEPLTVRDMIAGKDEPTTFPDENALRPWLMRRLAEPSIPQETP